MALAELIYFWISAATFSIMFHQFMTEKFLSLHSGYSFYINLPVHLTSRFSIFADFRQLQIPNAQMK